MPRDVFKLAFRASMSAEDPDAGELMLYGEIVQDYSKWYKENYPNDKSASDFDKAVKDLKAKGAKKLKLRINSPGGIVTEAIAMRAILTGAGFENISIRIEGMCASAATLIASIPGAHVEITPGSEYMIHNPWTFAWGTASDIEKTVDHLHQLEATSRGFYAQRSGQTDEKIKEWMDAETWFTAEQAVEYGFCDTVASESAAELMPAAACVTAREMAVMKDIYKSIPGGIFERLEDAGRSPLEKISNGEPDSGEPAEINSHKEECAMEISELTMEQLREGNPALFDQVKQEAVKAERERLEEIDALVFDFEKLDYISSAGLRVLLSAQKKMNAKGTMKVLHVNEDIMDVFDITGFSDVLTIE